MGVTLINMNNLHKIESAIDILSSIELDNEESIVTNEKEIENLIEKLNKIKNKLVYKDYSPQDFLELSKSKEIFKVGCDGMEGMVLRKSSLDSLRFCFNNAEKKKCFFVEGYNHLRLHLASSEDLEDGIYQAFAIKV